MEALTKWEQSQILESWRPVIEATERHEAAKAAARMLPDLIAAGAHFNPYAPTGYVVVGISEGTRGPRTTWDQIDGAKPRFATDAEAQALSWSLVHDLYEAAMPTPMGNFHLREVVSKRGVAMSHAVAHLDLDKLLHNAMTHYPLGGWSQQDDDRARVEARTIQVPTFDAVRPDLHPHDYERWSQIPDMDLDAEQCHALLAAGGHWDLEFVLAHPDCPTEYLDPRRYWHDGQRAAIASNPSTPPDVLQDLLEDQHGAVRQAALRNPGTPREARQRIQEHAQQREALLEALRVMADAHDLSPMESIILKLTEDHDLRPYQIAQHAGRSPSQIRVSLTRARQKRRVPEK